MATLTIRVPDDKHNRLKALAQYKKISINKLIEEMSTQTLAEFDSEIRFKALAATDSADQGFAMLEKLEALSPSDSH
jgi:predicted transcriptional regulator